MTKLRWGVLALFGTVCTGVAVAAPKPPHCAYGGSNIDMFGSGGKAIVCWGEDKKDCLSLDDDKAVSRPSAPTPAATVRDDAGKPSACNAKTCKPLGKKLAAAVAADGKARVTVTTDLGMVAIDGEKSHELWNVADDKKLAPKQPAVYQKKDKPELVRVEAVGALAFATWSDSGMITTGKEIVVLPDGGNHSKAFDAGDTVALDNGLYAVVGGMGLVTVLDKGGRHAGTLQLKMSMAMDGSGPSMVGIGNNELVVLSSFAPDSGDRDFVHITVSSDGKAKLGKTGTVVGCSN